VLAGRYRIVALLGRGGMGEVYRAEDLRLDQRVALKFLPDVLADDPVARELLIAEARHARDVAHPNVCRVYDIDELSRDESGGASRDADTDRASSSPRRGRTFLTMEYIDGEDLATLLRRIGKLPPSKALEIARQLCAGLAAAHDRGLLHRDLKPSNVMIDGDGCARITDFGLALKRSSRESSGDFAGTPAYMSPERLRGAPATVQSDLYALGLIVYETFTGQPAFSASTPGEWQHVHATAIPRRPSAVSRDVEPAVERFILRCLEKDSNRRPRSVAQALMMLPGADPLAATIAAGETPSPEMVAAAGAEGSVSRATAWLLLTACIATTVAVMALTGWVQLPSLVAFKGNPDVLTASARDVLVRLGYDDPPADSSWWLSVDAAYDAYPIANEPARLRFDELAAARPGPLVFHYRHSSRRMEPRDPSGIVSASDPAPIEAGDALVETDSMGRLIALQVRPATDAAAPVPGTQGPDWARLFEAAGVDRRAFTEAGPERVPPMHADTRAAWTGVINGAPVRIEAASWRGRPVFFELIGAWTPVPAVRRAWSTGAMQDLVTSALWLVTVIALAVLSARNLRMGRGDRRGALRVAAGILAALIVTVVIRRHWSFGPTTLWETISRQFGWPLFMASTAWLYYIGFEPFVRRRWPHLLIGWTRLLEGRVRDPLVGHALLAGVLGGAAIAGLVRTPEALSRLFDLTGTFPYAPTDALNAPNRFAALFFQAPADGVMRAFGLVAVMLVARLIVRSDRVAVAVAFLVSVLSSMHGGSNWPLELAVAVPAGLIAVTVLQRFGLLALCVVVTTFDMLAWSPLTLDPGRWFVWRSAAAFGATAGIAVWGFFNVLGRQSALPHGVFDE
jgi:serine/threonine-protein kinase